MSTPGHSKKLSVVTEIPAGALGNNVTKIASKEDAVRNIHRLAAKEPSKEKLKVLLGQASSHNASSPINIPGTGANGLSPTSQTSLTGPKSPRSGPYGPLRINRSSSDSVAQQTKAMKLMGLDQKDMKLAAQEKAARSMHRQQAKQPTSNKVRVLLGRTVSGKRDRAASHGNQVPVPAAETSAQHSAEFLANRLGISAYELGQAKRVEKVRADHKAFTQPCDNLKARNILHGQSPDASKQPVGNHSVSPVAKQKVKNKRRSVSDTAVSDYNRVRAIAMTTKAESASMNGQSTTVAEKSSLSPRSISRQHSSDLGESEGAPQDQGPGQWARDSQNVNLKDARELQTQRQEQQKEQQISQPVKSPLNGTFTQGNSNSNNALPRGRLVLPGIRGASPSPKKMNEMSPTNSKMNEMFPKKTNEKSPLSAASAGKGCVPVEA